MARCLRICIILFCCLFLGACSIFQTTAVQPAKLEVQSGNTSQANHSCAYFHFLWGTHQEFDEQYPQALEAYEKALACDPEADYVKEKIPVLLLKMGEFKAATDWLAKAIADHPDNNTYRLLLANLYIQQEEVEKAVPLYNEILLREPDNEGVHLQLALLYSHLGENDTAEAIFVKLLQNDVDSYFIHLSYARLLKQMERYPAAAEEYEKTLALNWSKDLAYEIGYFYVGQEMFDDALRIYTTITEEDPFDERAALSRTQALLDLDRNDEALAELDKIRRYSKDQANIDLIISKVLLRKNKVTEAKAILTRLVGETDSSEARYLLALLAYQEENYAVSLDLLAGIDADSDQLEDAVFLQTRIYQKLDNIEAAIELLKKHTSAETGRSPLFYSLLSSLYQATDQDDAALSTLQSAVTIYPENTQLLFEYGLLLDKNSRHEQAILMMEKVLELEPDHAEALNYIGYTWADRNMHLDKALEYILRAVALKPDNGFILDSLGWVYYRLGDLQQAVQQLERSVELTRNDPHIYDHLGDVYRSLHRFSEAIKVYKKAYALFKDEKDKVASKLKIDALENR